MKAIERALTLVGVSAARPAAFLVVACYALAWFASDPRHFGFQSVATIATWLMTLFIQRAEHRDTQALHAKLDELIRNDPRISNEVTGIDSEEPEVIVERRIDAMRKAT